MQVQCICRTMNRSNTDLIFNIKTLRFNVCVMYFLLDHLFQVSFLSPLISGSCMSLTSGSRSWFEVQASNRTRLWRSEQSSNKIFLLPFFNTLCFRCKLESLCLTLTGSGAEHRPWSHHIGHIWCQPVLCQYGWTVFPLSDGWLLLYMKCVCVLLNTAN